MSTPAPAGGTDGDVGRSARLPLRTQLTAVFAVLLVVGLVLSGFVAHTLLRRSLVSQLDGQLAAVSPVLLDELAAGPPQSGAAEDDTLPSDYYVVLADEEGATVRAWGARSTTVGTPRLPSMDVAAVLERQGEPFTVAGSEGDGRWRVLAQPLASADNRIVGSVAVALPMGSTTATLDQMRVWLVLIGSTVLVLGAVGGRWAVRRSLRPLNEIEETAAAIAAGDLSRRVPSAAPGTEVGHLATSLNAMLGQLEQSFTERAASQERMRRFVADAGHELRTPLATIRGYGELYRMGAVEGADELAQTFRRIEESATRMGVLVEDLMHLARLDEGRPQAWDPVDVAVLAADALSDLRALDPTREVRLVPLGADGSTSGAVVRGDEGRLRQVLANLVGNVARHTPQGSAAEVAVGRVVGADGRAQVQVEVRDRGPGIADEHAARVFERFYRVDDGRSREHGGAGLGLAIVAAIVATHHGTVDVAGRPGGGTAVRVVLPAADPAPDEASSQVEGTSEPGTRTPADPVDGTARSTAPERSTMARSSDPP